MGTQYYDCIVSLFVLTVENLKIKTEPAGRVPPDAILLSGNKSMQKCLLLAEGISFAGCL